MLWITACTTAATSTLEPAAFRFKGAHNLPAGFDVQGHRGARGLVPENTLPAFEAALDLGVTTLELDLHLTQDGEVVVWHDPAITPDKCRLDPDTEIEATDPAHPLRRIMIRGQTLESLRAYRCDLNPDAGRFLDQRPYVMPLAGDNYGLVSLGELFAFVETYAHSDLKTEAQRENAARVHFNVETKRQVDNPQTIDDGFDGVTAGPFELAVLEVVATFGLEERVVIQSFDHRSLSAIRAVNRDVRLAALTSGGNPTPEIYAAKGFDIWSPNYRDLTPELLAEAQRFNLGVIPWTINAPADMERWIEAGVDGIITDRPDVLLAVGR